MLVQSAKVDAFDFGSISADILLCEVDLSAHIVFLEILPKATQNGVVQASVEYVKHGFSFQISCRSCFSFSYAKILHAHLHAFY